jgi:DNA polymerase-3 subunit chi
MTKINYYQTQSEDLVKTFCKLTEKCYYSQLNTLVLTENDGYLESLDRALWTYSKKHFIPHATTNDSLQSDQSVFITTKVENPNNSEIIVFINPSKQMILNVLIENSPIDLIKIKKIIFLFDDTQKTKPSEIEHIIETSKIKTTETTYFTKTLKGLWQEVPSIS